RTKEISKTFLVAAAIYLVGNGILIPIVGLWGTAAMNVVTYLYAFLSIYRKGQKVSRVDFRMRSMLTYFGIYVVVLCTITYAQVQAWSGFWMVYLFSLAVMVAAVFMTGVFNKSFITYLRERLPNLIGKR